MCEAFWEKKLKGFFLTSHPTEDAVLNESETKQIAQSFEGPAREHGEQRKCCFQNAGGALLILLKNRPR